MKSPSCMSHQTYKKSIRIAHFNDNLAKTNTELDCRFMSNRGIKATYTPSSESWWRSHQRTNLFHVLTFRGQNFPLFLKSLEFEIHCANLGKVSRAILNGVFFSKRGGGGGGGKGSTKSAGLSLWFDSRIDIANYQPEENLNQSGL